MRNLNQRKGEFNMFHNPFNMKLKQNVKQAENLFNIQFNTNVKQNVKHTRNGVGEACSTQLHTPPRKGRGGCDEADVKQAPARHRVECETGWRVAHAAALPV